MQYESFIAVFVPVFLSMCGLLGLLAIVSPQMFGRVATRCGRWVDSAKLLAAFDKQINIDTYVLRHSRILGVLVIASVGVLGYLYVGA